MFLLLEETSIRILLIMMIYLVFFIINPITIFYIKEEATAMLLPPLEVSIFFRTIARAAARSFFRISQRLQ